MIQQHQSQRSQPKKSSPVKPLRFARLSSAIYWVRLAFFFLLVLFAALVALPTLLLGLILWWIASRAFDPHEYWRGLWAVAVFGIVVYAVWVYLGNPLPFLWNTLRFDLVRHLWHAAEQPGLLLWLFNLWLAPVCAPLLVGLFPSSLRRRVIAASPKDSSIQEEQEEYTRITRQLARLQQVTASMNEQSVPTAVTPFVQYGTNLVHTLGRYLHGELAAQVRNGLFCLPVDFFDLHGILAGEPKSGKSITLLRLAAIARAYGRRIIYLDFKGSRTTASLFLAVMTELGVNNVRMYTLQAYDGWRGDGQALYNRLMQQIDPVSHPFYRKGTGSTIISLACKAPIGPPRNSYEFMDRLDYNWLVATYARDVRALRDIENLAPYIAGAALVFSGFFRGINGGLDGQWAFEDCDACYVGINGIAHREEAAALGRYLLDDAAHFASARKSPEEKALLIIDEFGVLESTNATRLYEGVREAGLCVYSASQSYKSFGSERDDLLDASSIKILHRCGNPEPFVKYAGKREIYRFSRTIGNDLANEPEDLYHPYANSPDAPGGIIMRPSDEYTVPIEDVQQLEVGHVVVLQAGRPAYVQVQALELEPQLVQAAKDFIQSAGHYQPLVPPLVPTEVKKTEQQKNSTKKTPEELKQAGSGPKKPVDSRPQLLPPPRSARSGSGPSTSGQALPKPDTNKKPQAALPSAPMSATKPALEEDDQFDFFS
ncbi:MAG: hypothetical protein ACRDHW_00400 [Ktedonobacteraceae bacterium]